MSNESITLSMELPQTQCYEFECFEDNYSLTISMQGFRITQGSLIPKKHSHIMEARSGQNHDNKIAPQVNFNSTVTNIMDLLCIFVITKQYLFQRLSNHF